MSPAAESEQVESFRREVRSWLRANAPAKGSEEDFSAAHVERARCLKDYESELEYTMRRVTGWQRRLDDRGWGALGWPQAYGGRGESFRKVFAEEQAQVGVTTKPLAVGVEMVGPTLISCGTESQRSRYLVPMRRGDEVWCQLFSEPEAGSDLPSLQTRARETDRGWRLTGQKVWTSGASVSDFGLALARTDPGEPRHRGISAFVVNMRSPGVEVRPLRQLSGAYHFNEVFLTDVFVDRGSLIGSLNDGWRVATTMLSNERSSLGSGTSSGTPEELINLARRTGRSTEPWIRGALATNYSRASILRWLVQRSEIASDSGPGALVKWLYSDHARQMTNLGLQLLGAEAVAANESDEDATASQNRFYFAPGLRIAGGSDEIQRNIIAERILGLPRDLR